MGIKISELDPTVSPSRAASVPVANDGLSLRYTVEQILGLLESGDLPAAAALIAGLVPAADRLPYFNGANSAALATLTAFARTLLDDADAAAARATLSVPPASRNIAAGTGLTGGGDLSADRTLSLANMAAATVKGRAVGAGTGAPTDLTGTQVRDLAGAAPLPQTASGVGQFQSISTAGGAALVLPSGGTWAYHTQKFNGSGVSIAVFAGVGAGGATINAGSASDYHFGFAWRIA